MHVVEIILVGSVIVEIKIAKESHAELETRLVRHRAENYGLFDGFRGGQGNSCGDRLTVAK